MFKLALLLSLALLAEPAGWTATASPSVSTMPSQDADGRAALPLGNIADVASIAPSMVALAKETMQIYHDQDQRQYLDNLFRFQLIVGDGAAAIKSVQALRALDVPATSASQARDLQYEILPSAGRVYRDPVISASPDLGARSDRSASHDSAVTRSSSRAFSETLQGVRRSDGSIAGARYRDALIGQSAKIFEQ
jgi:glycerol-3-phosphate dehydrogenase